MEMTVSKERFKKVSEVIENFDGEEISFSFGDAADAGIGTDAGRVSAGSREELSADTAVWTHREDHTADDCQHPKRMATASVSAGTSHLSE